MRCPYIIIKSQFIIQVHLLNYAAADGHVPEMTSGLWWSVDGHVPEMTSGLWLSVDGHVPDSILSGQ